MHLAAAGVRQRGEPGHLTRQCRPGSHYAFMLSKICRCRFGQLDRSIAPLYDGNWFKRPVLLIFERRFIFSFHVNDAVIIHRFVKQYLYK